MRSATWPEYFPQGCPPGDAIPAEGLLFRFLRRREPAASDFDDHWTIYPQHRAAWHANREKHCSVCGLSVYRTLEAAKKKRDILPPLRKMHIASGTVTEPCGLIAPTPRDQNDHYTWWPLPSGAHWISVFQWLEGPVAAT